MNRFGVANAVAVARIFIEKTEELGRRCKNTEGYKEFGYIETCKESSAVKRASMDLTRALTELRRP